MNTVIPVLLIGVGGFLIGGVISLWNKSRLAAVLLALFSAGCILGGVLWLMGL